ncbi:MAG: site-2 protease family protein [Chlamydiota bacterium]
MIHIRGKIPITITPAFWIFAALIGFLSSGSFIGTFIWVGIIFVSVLFHELGHASMALLFGKKPRIELVAMGGVTFHHAEDLPFWKQFVIVLNGPLFGFLLFAGSTILLQLSSLNPEGLAREILVKVQLVNLFWTILNLLPILPLDGGQLMRIPLEAFFGVKGFKLALMISMILAFTISLAAFLYHQFFIGAILFLFAFQSLDTWKKSRVFSPHDQDQSIKDLLKKGEHALQAGDRNAAQAAFEEIRARAKKGLNFLTATQYLAVIEYELGHFAKVYELLSPIQEDISLDALCFLHRAAFAQEDFSLVDKLSGISFQQMPTADTALRNAYAAATLKKTSPALGWLNAAVSKGLQDLPSILSDKHFDPIRSDPLFQKFLEGTRS